MVGSLTAVCLFGVVLARARFASTGKSTAAHSSATRKKGTRA